MSSRKPKKQSGQTVALDLPVAMVVEMMAEAERLDRSVCYIVRTAWQISKGEIQRMKSMKEIA